MIHDFAAKTGLISALVLSVLLTGCSTAPADRAAAPSAAAPSSAAATATPATTAPIKVGSILSLTGSFSSFGIYQERIIRLLFEELNSKGGINGQPVQLTIYDDQTSPETALTFAKKVVTEDKASAMMVTGLASVVRALDPYIQTSQIPSVFSTPVVNPAGWSFTVTPDFDSAYIVRLEYMKARNIKKVAMLVVSDTTGQTGLDQMAKLAPQYGITVASESFGPNDTDVTPQLAKLKAGNPEAVLCEVSGKSFATVVKGFLQLGFNVPLFGSSGGITPTLPELLGGSVPGVNEPNALFFPGAPAEISAALPVNDPRKVAIDRMLNLYKTKFQDQPNLTALSTGYDAGTLLIDALKRAGSPDKKKIRDALETTKGLNYAFGTVNMTPQDHRGLGKAGYVLVSYKGGKFSLPTN